MKFKTVITLGLAFGILGAASAQEQTSDAPIGTVATPPAPITSTPASTQEDVVIPDADELVLLSSTGILKEYHERPQLGERTRLRPAGGLFVSFDENEDNVITRSEIIAGIPVAFAAADTNEDGVITAIEQLNWARSLPTHDETLSNPVRFDPNLDRQVEPIEFEAIILNLSQEYADEDGNIPIAALTDTSRRIRFGEGAAPSQEPPIEFPRRRAS